MKVFVIPLLVMFVFGLLGNTSSTVQEHKSLPAMGDSNPAFKVVYEGEPKFSVTHGGEVNVTQGPLHVNAGNFTMSEGMYQCLDGLACTKYIKTNSSSLVFKVT